MSLTEEQKARRREGVGGSEIGAILGVNPFAGPIDVYAAKIDGREIPDNFNMERGRFYERPTAEWRVYRHGGTLWEPGTIQSAKNPVAICTPDFLVESADGWLDLSIKCPGPFTRGDWGDDGTDVVPYYALVQLQYELAVLGELRGIDRGEIAATIGGDLRCYPMRADLELQAMLIEAAERFFRDHILPRKPPPVDGTDSYAEYLAGRYPQAAGSLLPFDAGAEKWAQAYQDASNALKTAEALKKTARNQLVALIGSADGIDGVATYRNVAGRASVDWEAVCMEAEVPPSTVAKHTRKTSHRSIRVTRQGGNDE